MKMQSSTILAVTFRSSCNITANFSIGKTVNCHRIIPVERWSGARPHNSGVCRDKEVTTGILGQGVGELDADRSILGGNNCNAQIMRRLQVYPRSSSNAGGDIGLPIATNKVPPSVLAAVFKV